MFYKKFLVGLMVGTFLILPTLLSEFWVSIFISIMAMIVLTAGFRMIYITGRLSLGHTFPVGIGAYTSVLLCTKTGVSFWFGLLLGGVMAGITALMLGYVILRISGIYFVVVTLAMAEIFIHLLLWAEPLTGGVTGVVNIPGPVINFPWVRRIEFGYNLVPYYYLIFAIMFVSVGIMYLMEKSHIGRVFHALRQNDLLAEHVGINITSYRVIAFVTASFFAGLVGSFLAHYHHYTCPDDFHVMESLFIQIYTFIGGIGSLTGAIIGPLAIITVSEIFRVAKEAQPLFYAGIMLLVIMWLPGGLVTIPSLLRKWRNKKGYELSKHRTP
jgi:branched-chain amino acid transport system permease protein